MTYVQHIFDIYNVLAHTFNKENRIKHDLHLEVCHISKELDGVPLVATDGLVCPTDE